jgi:hypothetical protein
VLCEQVEPESLRSLNELFLATAHPLCPTTQRLDKGRRGLARWSNRPRTFLRNMQVDNLLHAEAKTIPLRVTSEGSTAIAQPDSNINEFWHPPHRGPNVALQSGQWRTHQGPTGDQGAGACTDPKLRCRSVTWGLASGSGCSVVFVDHAAEYLVALDQAAQDGSAPDPSCCDVGDRVVGLGWLEVERAVRASLVSCRAYWARTARRCGSPKIRHTVGHLCPDREHEPLRIGIRARTSGRSRVSGTRCPA